MYLPVLTALLTFEGTTLDHHGCVMGNIERQDLNTACTILPTTSLKPGRNNRLPPRRLLLIHLCPSLPRIPRPYLPTSLLCPRRVRLRRHGHCHPPPNDSLFPRVRKTRQWKNSRSRRVLHRRRRAHRSDCISPLATVFYVPGMGNEEFCAGGVLYRWECFAGDLFGYVSGVEEE